MFRQLPGITQHISLIPISLDDPPLVYFFNLFFKHRRTQPRRTYSRFPIPEVTLLSMSYQLLSNTRPTCDRPPRTLIHILNDDCLLHMVSLCRPVILDEGEAVNSLQILGGGEWSRERWWYRLVQVCRKWRYLILESASHLRLSLVCAPGTPVTDMLAHWRSPPLPLIDYLKGNNDVTAKDEEGLIYALRQRDRVRRIRLLIPVQILE